MLMHAYPLVLMLSLHARSSSVTEPWLRVRVSLRVLSGEMPGVLSKEPAYDSSQWL